MNETLEKRPERNAQSKFPSKFEELKRALFNAGIDALDDFCDMDLDFAKQGKDVIESILDEVYQQMPDDMFDKFCNKYLNDDAQKEAFEQKCYEAYQLDWMISHGYSIRDYLLALVEEDEKARENGDYPEDDALDIAECFNARFEYESGFNGESWAGKAEFLDAEFLDAGYMGHLFSMMPGGSEMRAYYVKTYKRSLANEKMEVATPAGVLRAYKQEGYQPGIAITFQPAAYEDEIDLVMASSIVDEKYQSDDKEKPDDVLVHVWGDPGDECYTDKHVITREDVITGLGTAAHA